ncbi:MAG TPA: LapA family protein [Burkholderiales bacterium]
MRLVTWTIRLALFLLLLVFAVWNTEPVTLRYWFDRAWQAPLVVVLLAFFAAGALFGIAAVLGGSLRQRREIGRLRREARAQPEPPPGAPPPVEG